MKTIDYIRKRRSVRKYKHKKIKDDVLYEIIDAGRWAPSAGNLQTWRFIVVDDPDLIKDLSRASLNQDWIAEAPVIVVVCSLTKKVKRWYSKRGELYAIQNTSAAIENMIIAATARGIASCWVGAFTDSRVRRLLNIPDEVDIHALITFGYANECPRVPQRFRLWDIICFNEWDNRKRRADIYPIGEHPSLKRARAKGAEVKSKLKNIAKKIKKL